MITGMDARRTWLVTGAAGFIGSHLVEQLLLAGQRVVGVDNFSTGLRENLDLVRGAVSAERGSLFSFFEQDIRDRDGISELVSRSKPDVILHQAALGSVPRSIEDPLSSHESNVDGFINMLDAARKVGVQRVVYASSSSVYGDIGDGAKVEDRLGAALSPYAATKRIGEIYAQVYGRTYGLETVGLRYFNVFGPRQDPNGPYAAVIPRWLAAMAKKNPTAIYGDGSGSRDFCYITNVVQANLLAASVPSSSAAIHSVVNIGCGATTTLMQLQQLLRRHIARVVGCQVDQIPEPALEPIRQGDVPHSLADISFARESLGYNPTHSVEQGIAELVQFELAKTA